MHDDAIKWKYFLRYWPFVLGIHRSPVNSQHKGQWRGALMFILNKRLCKQSRRWWFATPSRSLRRHSNGMHECGQYTVYSAYLAVIFLQRTSKWHPVARPTYLLLVQRATKLCCCGASCHVGMNCTAIYWESIALCVRIGYMCICKYVYTDMHVGGRHNHSINQIYCTVYMKVLPEPICTQPV